MARGDGAGERGVRDPRRTGAVYAIREPAPLGGSVVPAGVRWSGDFHDGTVEYLFVRVRVPVAHNTGLRCGGPGAPGRAVSIGRRLIEAFHLLLHPTGRGRGRMSRAFGAGLEGRKPPVMPVVHRIGLSLPEGDGIGALLRFLGNHADAPLFEHENPGVVYVEPGLVHRPADLAVWREHINGAFNREAEGFPAETHALREGVVAAFDLDVRRIGIPRRPLRSVHQIFPNNSQGRIDPALVMHKHINVARIEALRPMNQRRREVDPKGWTNFGRRLDGAAG
jgi:hypothetical protein